MRDEIVSKTWRDIDDWPTELPVIAMRQVSEVPRRFGFMFKDERDAIYQHPTFIMAEASDVSVEVKDNGDAHFTLRGKPGFTFPPKTAFTRIRKYEDTLNLIRSGWLPD